MVCLFTVDRHLSYFQFNVINRIAVNSFNLCVINLLGSLRPSKDRYLHYNSQPQQTYCQEVAMRVVLWSGHHHVRKCVGVAALGRLRSPGRSARAAPYGRMCRVSWVMCRKGSVGCRVCAFVGVFNLVSLSSKLPFFSFSLEKHKICNCSEHLLALGIVEHGLALLHRGI